ncbi:MAG: L-2-hydroxyglutarate oxidase [Acidobacteriota bacterium]
MNSDSDIYDVAVIGGGIVGMATAMALMNKCAGKIVVIEKEDGLAKHQTGHNSGVIHSGLYYKPGSLKALNCKKGRDLLYEFLENENIPHERCGKLVVATNEEEIPNLMKLIDRGKENCLQGLKLLDKSELQEYEPHISGVKGIFVPETGIVDYKTVTEKYGELFKKKGGEILFNSKVKKIIRKGKEIILETPDNRIKTKWLINCAGLFSDKIAKMSGVDPGLKIIPFRGEYYEIKKGHHHLVKNLIYPVPDPKFPFLGVHFTRMIGGGVEAGPNAVTAMKREGYTKLHISVKDIFDFVTYPGFWKMAKQHWRISIMEYKRSFFKSVFVKSLQKLIPEIKGNQLKKSPAGVRAQALEPDGNLLDDFRILEVENMIHVLNAPSPAATASLAIGETIAGYAKKNFTC